MIYSMAIIQIVLDLQFHKLLQSQWNKLNSYRTVNKSLNLPIKLFLWKMLKSVSLKSLCCPDIIKNWLCLQVLSKVVSYSVDTLDWAMIYLSGLLNKLHLAGYKDLNSNISTEFVFLTNILIKSHLINKRTTPTVFNFIFFKFYLIFTTWFYIL